MLQGIIDNAGTIVVSLMLTGLVVLIIVKMRRDKRRGQCSCGCNCGSCPMGGSCHKAS